MIYWNWTLPWNEEEVLVGFLVAETINVLTEYEEKLTGGLFSIGLLIGRIDIIYNLNKEE